MAALPRWVALLGLLAGGACARNGGELREWVWREREAAFRMGPLPPSWEVVDEGQAAEFRDRETGAVILADADCRESADAPLTVLTNTLLIGFTDRQVRDQERVPLAGREALRSVVDARLDGVPVAVESYVLKRDGCAYDLVYVAPPDRFERARPAFRRLVEGFAPVDR